MLIHPVAKLGILADWREIAVFFTAAMMTYRCNGIGRTIRAGPNNIGAAERFQDLFSRDIQYVSVEIDILKIFVPLDTKYFVSVFLKCFADTACSGK